MGASTVIVGIKSLGKGVRIGSVYEPQLVVRAFATRTFHTFAVRDSVRTVRCVVELEGIKTRSHRALRSSHSVADTRQNSPAFDDHRTIKSETEPVSTDEFVIRLVWHFNYTVALPLSISYKAFAPKKPRSTVEYCIRLCQKGERGVLELPLLLAFASHDASTASRTFVISSSLARRLRLVLLVLHFTMKESR